MTTPSLSALGRWWHALLPQSCRLCAQTSPDAVCPDCAQSLSTIPVEACPRCQLDSVGGQVCGRCLKKPPRWGRLVAPWLYAFPFDRLLLGAKYHADFASLAWCAGRAAERRADFGVERLTVIPVPLAPERLAERGYNQAEQIARALLRHPLWRADRFDVQAVLRVRATAPQQGLDWRARRANVRGAFAATGSLAGEAVLLVDDVLTTGATLNELARVVLAAGAVSVDCLVLARVLPPQRRQRLSRMGQSAS